MPSEELRSIACELGDQANATSHPLWPVFVLLHQLEIGRKPTTRDVWVIDDCPAHF